MRRKTNRTNQILEALTETGRIEVTQLAQKIGVSQVTVRKDLEALEQKGIIRREHGYALLNSEDDLNGRLAYHYELKKIIAKKACETVRDGETVMIENGSCCALLAEALTQTRKGLTIITNSAFIADHIRNAPDTQIILLGGTYQPDSRVNVGPLVAECAKNFYVSRFFVGTDGYAEKVGFTNKDQMRAQAVRDMAGQAESVIVLTESEKFSRHGVVPLNVTDRISAVITDSRIPEEALKSLQKKNIEVIRV